MQTARQFTYPPSNYRDELKQSNPLWYFWLPIASIVAIFLARALFIEWTKVWLFSEERGLVEFIHFLFPALVALIGLRLLFFPQIRKDPLLLLWALALAVGGIYLSGEEASWGQHYFAWATPESWKLVNDQGETNLHNTSRFFDQLPRAFLVAGIIFAGLIMTWILSNRPELPPRRFDILYPALALRTLAACVLFSEFYLQAKDLFFLIIAASNMPRPGEIQETYLVWFLLYYALLIYWRAHSLHQPGKC